MPDVFSLFMVNPADGCVCGIGEPSRARQAKERIVNFSLVDVFGVADFSGNPVAVVHDANGLDTEQMQRITRWLNLSETTFLLPPTDPQADYRVRIFTLDR